MIPQKIGRYEVKSEIGRGGMATIYLANDPRFKRDVAVKVLASQYGDDPTFRARFEREAQAIAAIEHPAIVPVYDFGEEDDLLYLVMRFMPGGSLSDRLDHGPLNFTETAQIISRLAPALDAVHGRGIIHRDLKPGNILFDQYGNAFLSDFGIARLTHATTTLTGEAVVGTPAYMSPEQVRGEDIDGRSDIYALGAILFEMLTGKQPYEATTPIAVALKQITEPVPRILDVKSDLPPECETLIRKAMAKDRERRFATAADFAAEHQAIIEKPRSEILPPPLEKVAAPTPAPLPPIQAAPPGSPAPRRARAAMSKPAAIPAGQPPTSAPLPGVRAKAGVRRSRLPLWLSFGAGTILVGGMCLVAGFFIVSQFLDAPKTPTAKASPSVSVTPQIAQSTPLPVDRSPLRYEDDFEDAASGWPAAPQESGVLAYDSGYYRIRVDRPDSMLRANPGLEYQDVRIDAEVTLVSGAPENYFGILCRYLPEKGDFYFLTINSTGYYAIYKYIQGAKILLTAGVNDYIHLGKTSNRLQAECIKDTLTFYVNDIRVAQVQDASLAAGDVGLAAEASDIGNTNILFDNFVVENLGAVKP